MNSKTTYIWGVAADSVGIIHHSRVEGEKLPGGGLRVRQHHEYAHEPASAYAVSHPAPMPMRWGHREEIGKIVALRRAHGQLYAIGESTELEPGDLAGLTEKFGDLRWSTSTNNRRRDLLRIDEISLTPGPATVGLHAVRWYKLDVTKGNPPVWVKEALERASKTEYRSRGELRIHEAGPVMLSAAEEYEQLGRDLGMIPGGFERRYIDPLTGEEVEMFIRPGGPILSVEGRPVRR